jgi:secondary thiamine-phosphate synthase enzyme
MASRANRSSSSFTRTLNIKTSRRTELKDVTAEIEAAVRESGCTDGVCHLYVPHTTAGVLVNEGDDPAVARDIEATLDRLIPHSAGYKHAEGNSDSHIKTALIGSSETVWIENGRLSLGRWQAVFFAEFDGPRVRELRIKIVPDPLPSKSARWQDR